MRWRYAGAIAALVVLAAACGDNPASETPTQPTAPPLPPPQPPPPAAQQVYATPLQARIAQLLAARQARGEPIPTVSFEFSSPQGASLAELQSRRYGPGEGYSYRAKTVIHYDGPAQAGLQRWAPLTLTPQASRAFKVDSRQFRDRYVAKMDQAHPGFWARYELGSEPRTFTITEVSTVVYPEGPPVAFADVLSTSSTQDQFVLGFSIDGPHLADTISFGIPDVETVDFSYILDMGVGIRLPLLAALDGPETMAEGSTYSASSTVDGVDWSEADFEAAGIPVRNGKEAYLFFIAKACVGLSGVIDVDPFCKGPDVGNDADFATSLGSGPVPLPTLSLDLLDYYLAGIRLDVTPVVGSDKLTADWGVAGTGLGGGDVLFSTAGSPVSLSPVTAVDGPGDAVFSLDALRYHFTEFGISPAVTPWVDLELVIFPDWEDEWPISLGTYDLTSLIGATGLDLAVGVHAGTQPVGLTLDVPVLNVAPTAQISLVGGPTVNVNGVATVFGNVGGGFTFTGSSSDPGRDDLTLSWDWDDGGSTPDVSQGYALVGDQGPNNAANEQSHTFGQACMYGVTFKSEDDDGATGEDHVTLLVTEVGNAARMEGYWQSQLRRTDGSPDVATLGCYLEIVRHVSAVFDETNLPDIEAAFATVNARQNGGSESAKLDRDLLVAWLNFARGAFRYTQSVDTDGDGIADTPFNEVMQWAETVRADPLATAAALKQYATMVHQISAQFTQDVTPE
jgi:hypothetical protein